MPAPETEDVEEGEVEEVKETAPPQSGQRVLIRRVAKDDDDERGTRKVQRNAPQEFHHGPEQSLDQLKAERRTGDFRV